MEKLTLMEKEEARFFFLPCEGFGDRKTWGYGRIKFLGETDVWALDLDSAVMR